MSQTKAVTPDLLRELPTFEGLSDLQLEHVVPLTRLEDLPADGQLLRQGEPATDIHIVVTGRFGLTLGLGGHEEQLLLTVTRGEIIGWSALLDQTTWLASAKALKPSSVLVIGGNALRDLCESEHEIGYHVMRNLFAAVAARLHDTRLQLVDMYAHG
jgi:CRP-like cAMP-binding protein